MRSPDSARLECAAELGFDGASEAVGAVEVLALQMCADSLDFLLGHIVHHECTVAGLTLLDAGRQFAVGAVWTNHWVVRAERVAVVA